ncbi:class I SAM-dependent methyltransferase [Halomicrococcus gelatinilyticus]|uniref:class I SAM-dependent methyltransferase n=1 Tax=Halomicrococcus gelatinilyticus TaxID=1702103 RepID=UPI002E15C924
MTADRLRTRITEQFSRRGQRADIWRLFALVLDTNAFLNLGYSEWYQPHVVGDSQRRLATAVGRRLAARLPTTEGVRLLDVGCGRGGPTVHLAERFGFAARGVDLVPYNVARARENARERDADAAFLVADATRLPFASGSLPACVGIDAFVYIPDREAVFAAIADALEPGGVLAFSDLLARADADETERRAVTRFAEAWDMPALGSRPEYEAALTDAGLDVIAVEDISPHSVGRFRKWTTLYDRLHDSPVGRLVDRLVARRGADPAAVTEQIRRAHEALPSLRHVCFVAEK